MESVAARLVSRYIYPMKKLLVLLLLGPGLSYAGGSKAPYKWYPDLNLNKIPFHKADGAWGPKSPIVAPDAPVTTRQVTVTTATQFRTAALVPGTEITVGADILEPFVVQGNITDVDVIIPAGRTTRQISFGGWNPGTVTQRLRVRGTVPMSHSGGQVGTLTFYGNSVSDLIIDGLDMVDGTEASLWHLAGSISGGTASRVAVINNRGRAGGPGNLGYSSNYVIAGNNFVTGEYTRAQANRAEAWGIRTGGTGAVVVYRNRIDGTRYHRVRAHPKHTPNEYIWVSGNIFFDRTEARIFDVFRVGDSLPGERTAAAWFDKNTVYAESSSGMTPSMQANHTNYARVTNNTCYGILNAAQQKIIEGVSEAANKDFVTGNTYSAWQDPPAWVSPPGDPRQLVLPAPPKP